MKQRRGIKLGTKHHGGKIKNSVGLSGNSRVAHTVSTGGGGVSQHAGQVPKIKNSVNHSIDQMNAARAKSHPSTHPVKVSGGCFSGSIRGK
jgi:hypothetical protein